MTEQIGSTAAHAHKPAAAFVRSAAATITRVAGKFCRKGTRRAFFYAIAADATASVECAIRIAAASPDHAGAWGFIGAARASRRTVGCIINNFYGIARAAVRAITDTAALAQRAIVFADTYKVMVFANAAGRNAATAVCGMGTGRTPAIRSRYNFRRIAAQTAAFAQMSRDIFCTQPVFAVAITGATADTVLYIIRPSNRRTGRTCCRT
jgi:hypothetical protein